MKKLLVMAAMVLSSVGAFAQYSAGDFGSGAEVRG